MNEYIQNNIIAFPTHSPTNDDCCWITYSPHLSIIPHPTKTILSIGHGQSMTLNISTHTPQQQRKRAFVIYYKIQTTQRPARNQPFTTLTHERNLTPTFKIFL